MIQQNLIVLHQQKKMRKREIKEESPKLQNTEK